MGWGFRDLGRAIGALIRAGCTLFLFIPAALADCAPVTAAPHCAAYLNHLADGACLSAGSTFMQKGSTWKDITGLNTTLKSSKATSVSFFFVVDATLTQQKNLTSGLVFVGITRSFKGPQPTEVKLTHNDGDDKQFEDLKLYSRAMQGAPPDQILNSWGKTSSVYLFEESSIPLSVRSGFDLGPEDVSRPALHARLYTFDPGNALECIPFTAGLDSTLNYIEGKEFDVFGGAKGAGTFVVTITPSD